jgi:uncharacterized protein
MQKFRILSIDGGGLRGVVPIRILQAIESKTGKKIHQLFDMMAGTSTGGLIVSCLTLKNPSTGEPLYTLEQLSKMYTEEGGTIFPIRSKIGHIIEQAHNLLRPEFSADGMDKVLKMYISNQKIKDSLLPILVTTYDLSTIGRCFSEPEKPQKMKRPMQTYMISVEPLRLHLLIFLLIHLPIKVKP